MKITKQQESEVMPVYNTWWKSYLNGDVKTYDYFLDDDYRFVGSTEAEAFLDRKDTTKFFEATADQLAGKSELRNSILKAEYFDGLIFITELADAYLLYGDDWTFYGKFRFSSVLKKNKDGWRFIYQHFSTPDSKAQEGETIGTEQIAAENLQLRDAIKRRTFELENKSRELEIEASLERVRAQAMGMTKPDDLLSICEVSFNEFKKLGFDSIRNALIHIQYDEQKYFMDYDFSDLTGGAITKIEYGSHPVVEDYLKQIRSAKDAFYQGVIKEDQLEEWKNFRRNSGQIDDPRLDKATALYYYFFSIGIGDIGISTLEPINESQVKILKRFRNVFDLAYRRYTDITRAEAQAREAQIEVAVEKVRSRTMGMQRSNELQDAAALMFQQIESLGVNIMGCGFNIWDEDKKEATAWMSGMQRFQPPFKTTSSEDIFLRIHKAAEKGELLFVEEQAGDEVIKHYEYMASIPIFKKILDQLAETGSSAPSYQIMHCAFFTQGYLMFISLQPVVEAYDIFKRFAKVFEQTYTRFLDLQKAEAQAREAKIEASMEKIRSRSLAMQKPGELVEVSELLRKEMGLLGVEELETSSIYIVDEENQRTECWYAIKDIREENKRLVSDEMTLILSNTWVGNEMWKFYRSKKEQTSIVMKGDNRKEWINYCVGTSKVLQGYYGNEIPERTYHLVKFNGGYMGAASPGDISLESWDLLKRAAAVFSLAYTRFKDLLDAEARAREAQIEASLERVRSRSMGMQKSEQLKNVIQVVYEQFVHLKINVDHAGFVVDYIPKGDWHFWIADEQDIPSKITHPYFESVWANQFNEAKEKGADLFATNLNFEEKNKFYDELLSYVPGLPEASKDFYLSCPGLAATTVLFDNVSLYIENFSGTPYSDEENKILMRFGKVFQQTYTRFLDLVKVEAQNQIIQADNDRKTKELEEARQLQLSMLPKELPQFPNLDIAVYMKTATEVGGDYYDFNIDDNGTLTVLVGDATGHGMMSGMMVSIMKSFFISNRRSLDLKQFFENANNSLKEMHLGRLMMTLIGVQINSEKLIATNAGMPSLLYFRNKSQKAGEFVSHNFPLGAMKGTKYLLKEINYEIGDTLLLMSDGFAELKNEKNEQYGYERVKKEFMSVAQKNPDEIVEHLNASASEWIIGVEPDDDVTFVVIKVK